MNTSLRRRDALKTIAACAVLPGAGALFTACSEKKPSFHGVDITGAEYARDLELTDHNGQQRSLKDFRGKVVVVFFGYTQCPDVCPTSLQELAEAKRLLGPDGERLQGIFVTIDPERDTPGLLKAYMANFDPNFIALRGTPEQTAAVAKEFKVYYKKIEGKTPTSYTMDHSAGSYIFDPEGRVRVFHRYGSGAQALADDLRTLLRESP
ncbi:SCO family protein [Extensimonas perlucida]|uniref:SCO family protein n=1 Tax=Extensimonas perlucida TaxID=2590786 RepID=UPI0011AABCAA|nr:SCO family protein [Extensimonas perlucida]